MTQTNQQNVPKLRFPSFYEPLDCVKLGEVASFSKGKGISKSDIHPDGALPCIRYGELYTVYDTVIDEPISRTNVSASALVLSEGGEVLVPASGEDAKDIATAAVVTKSGVALGGDLNIIRSKNDGAFLASYLSGRKRMSLAAMAQGNSVVHLYATQLKSLDVHLPTLPEQRKIASFLGAVDTKIAQLSRKKALLEDYKKGCMQQLFSQKIRFKDDDGNDFPDWEEKRLGEIGEVRTSSVDKLSQEGERSVKLLNYMDVYRRDHIRRTDKFQDITAPEGQIFVASLLEGDVLFTPSSETPTDIGHSAVVMENLNSVLFSYHLMRFRPNPGLLEPLFSGYAFKSHKFYVELWKRAQGATRYTLSKSALEESIVHLPHPSEQRKIADFLSALDRKINLVAQELNHARAFKKGLLQQMFV